MNPFTYNVVLINILTNSVSSSIMAGKPPSDDEDPSAAPSGGSAIDEDAVPVSAIEPARCGLIGLGGRRRREKRKEDHFNFLGRVLGSTEPVWHASDPDAAKRTYIVACEPQPSGLSNSPEHTGSTSISKDFSSDGSR